ncbi:hypothetical protein V1508DRAFT_75324 [Lipomyces doorenjongii]|uniref:uncharacterized protein n=1 Tax=Lipomyces doorenjongii TaxID=383834 RepID=UPI0034D01347
MPGTSRQHQKQVALTAAASCIVTISFIQFYTLVSQYIVLAGSVEDVVSYSSPIMYDSTPFNFNSIDDSEAIFRFRFSKDQILSILPYLRLDLIQWSHRYRPDHLTAFCILLRRLAYPERWGSMVRDFGRSQSYLCSVTRDVVFILCIATGPCSNRTLGN